MPEENARHISGLLTAKYPALVGQVLFGSVEVERVVRRVVEFAASSREFVCYTEDLRRIVASALSPNLLHLSPDELRTLKAITYDIGGMSLEWFAEKGEYPPEALFLHVIALSHFYYYDADWVTIAFIGLPAYPIQSRDVEVCHLLMAATYDFSLAYRWEYFLDVLFAHTAVSASVVGSHQGCRAVVAKLFAESSWDALADYYYSDWSNDVEEELRGDWDLLRNGLASSGAFSEELFSRVVRDVMHTLSFIEELLRDRELPEPPEVTH